MKQQNPTDSLVAFDELPDSGFVRLGQLLSSAVIPFSATTTWRRVREGTFPQPVRVSPQITAWRVGEIREWLRCPAEFVAGRAKVARTTPGIIRSKGRKVRHEK